MSVNDKLLREAWPAQVKDLIPLRSVWARQTDTEWMGVTTKAEDHARIVITGVSWEGITALDEGFKGVRYLSVEFLLDNYYMVGEACHIELQETYR